jgi:hypothetical protein
MKYENKFSTRKQYFVTMYGKLCIARDPEESDD